MSLRPKKSLGQHFLRDPNMIRKMVGTLRADRNGRVIEIGPGTGNMTSELQKNYDDLHAIEVDERSVELLKRKFPNVRIHHIDILEVDWSGLSIGKEKTHVIGNIPYYITSQILFSLLSSRFYLSEAILMMQKEVAERLTADIGTKQYGILSVQTQLFSTPEILFRVKKHLFHPPPKVESSVVRLTFDKGLLSCSDSHLKQVVRTAFNQRRKKLKNSLKPILNKNLPAGFDFDKRAEAWKPDKYVKLTEILEQSGILT